MKILIIQTAFIGDVVLATPVIEKLSRFFPQSRIDFMLRKGNEVLLENHPKINEVIIWDKRTGKLKNLIALASRIRKKRYDLVVNLHCFLSTGLLTVLSGAEQKIGFRKNPLSFLFDERYEHTIGEDVHEVNRNLKLIAGITDDTFVNPKIYLTDKVLENVKPLKPIPYLTIAPASVWETKRFPIHKWIAFLNQVRFDGRVYLLGGPSDHQLCEQIRLQSRKETIDNLCGRLTLPESAALMKDAVMNYMNDSGPLHLASAINAPTCVVFCSTVPAFGFGPLADVNTVIETGQKLNCRPCGLHGYKACPEGHFNCAESIDVKRLVEVLG